MIARNKFFELNNRVFQWCNGLFGGNVIAQDEASCVVYGMPKAAVELSAVDEVLDLSAMPDRLTRLVA